MVGATHITASAMPLADMRYRDRRDQRESVGAGNGNCSLTDGRDRPMPDAGVVNHGSEKRSFVQRDVSRPFTLDAKIKGFALPRLQRSWQQLSHKLMFADHRL